MDLALQEILQQLNELNLVQEKVAAYQELKKDANTDQDKLVASQEELQNDINAGQDQLAASQEELKWDLSTAKTNW
jgi:hypothetical protein